MSYHCPILEIPKQDFFQEAKTLIAQHYKKINENKVPGTSINVFRNKHQKTKSRKFIPLEIKEKETLDTVRELQAAYKMICFPKDCSKSGHSEEAPSRTSFKEPHIFNVKKKYKGSIDLIVKEQVNLGKIVTNIDSVSKKMEKEKQQHHAKTRSRMLYFLEAIKRAASQSKVTSHIEPEIMILFEHFLFTVNLEVSAKLVQILDRAFYDWRGVVSKRFSCLARDSSWPSFSGSSSVFQDYCRKSFIKKEQQSVKPESKPQPSPKSILSKSDKLDNKVKRIGPQMENFKVFRGRKKFVITKNIVRMVIVMQALVRGWLERKRFQRIMIKALYHGPDLRTVINMYCRLIHRVKYRLGLWRTRQIINLTELEEWMDRKKFYETVFARREDWQGLERSELLKYFNDCGHFPMHQQIDEVWDLVHREDHAKYSDIIKKSNAIEMLFTLYPPQGAHVRTNMRLRSTWLRPIVNGEEGYKYIVSGHPILKRANIQIVGKLVAKSMRERKMKQQYSS
ncbi:IQ domain-containing protein M [Phocoena phocoena]|uniref:IQ domain-containing protein M n=1 Tax=Phocoena phocoena TaxID=9742 RepID=UPI003307388C